MEDIDITHRAESFAFGRGDGYYGIWQIRGSDLVLVESHPKTAAGWFQAWARFNEYESYPELVDHFAERTRGRSPVSKVTFALLVAGIAIGIGGLFPAYLSGASLAGQTDQLVEHVLFLAGWAAAAVMMTRRQDVRLAGVVFSVALSATVFGFYFSDLGSVISSGAHVAGAGLILTLLGWFFCAEASIVAISQMRRSSPIGRPRTPHSGVMSVATLLGVGVAVTFAPAWDSFRLYAAATGQTNTLTAGNAFTQPGAVIAGNVVVMVMVVIFAILASSWRPRHLGASLLAGALIPMIAQLISAIVQNASAPSPATFGISAAQAAQEQLHVSTGFTPVFYLYCAFVAALACFCVAQFVNIHHEPRQNGSFVDLPPYAVQ